MKIEFFNLSTEKIELLSEDENSRAEILKIVVSMDKDYFPFPWSSKNWNDALCDESMFLMVGVFNKQIAAYALFHNNKWDESSHLYKIIVHPDQRRSKLGLKMLSHAEKSLESFGMKSVYLEVSENNVAGQALYSSLGYEKLCIKKKFYSSGEGGIAMRKMLN